MSLIASGVERIYTKRYCNYFLMQDGTYRMYQNNTMKKVAESGLPLVTGNFERYRSSDPLTYDPPFSVYHRYGKHLLDDVVSYYTYPYYIASTYNGGFSIAVTSDGSVYTWNTDTEFATKETAYHLPDTPPAAALMTSVNRAEEPAEVQTDEEVFTDLLPEEIYNFYYVQDADEDDAFSDGNLIYLAQQISDETGTLTVSYPSVSSVPETAKTFMVGMSKTSI